MSVLNHVCLTIVDCEHKTAPIQDSGIPCIRTTDIKNGVIDFQGANKVSEDIYKEWTYRLEPQSYDLILAREAPVGQVGIIPNRQQACLGQRTVLIRPNKEKIYPHYLLYLLLSPEIQHEMKIRSSGSTVEHLNMFDIRGLELPELPQLKIQKEIGDTLANLDAKIENLRSQNQTLEKIAQTLFDRWFIDFEFPNDSGEPYKSSGGSMVPSELGDIPDGWRVGNLGGLGKNTKNGIRENDIKSEMLYIGLEHIPRKQIALDSWSNALNIGSNKSCFCKGDILFGKLRPYFHKVGVAFISGVCSTDILVIQPNQESDFGFLLMILSSNEFINYVSLASEGTRMPRTSWQYMQDYPVCIPDINIINSFNNLLMIFVEKMETNVFQIQTLTKTRDTLLPKLMSGQIRVAE